MTIKKNRKLSLRQKIFLLIFGFAVSAILLEVCLRLSSLAGSYILLPKYNFSDIKPEEKVIFCFGDSFTHGSGAGFNNSYPLQMEKLFVEHFKEQRVRVFNFGIPGNDSKQIFDRLKINIKKLHPDIVIVIAGMNDYWKFNNKFNKDRRWFTVNIAFLEARFRIVKFINVVFENISKTKVRNFIKKRKKNEMYASNNNKNNNLEFINKANMSRDKALFNEAQRYYDQVLKKYPGHKTALLEKGRCYKLSGDFEKAGEVLAALFEKYPSDEKIYAELKDVLSKIKDDKAILEIYSDVHKKFSSNEIIVGGFASAYVKLGGEFFLEGDFERANYFYSKALILDANRSQKHRQMLREVTLSKKIYSNLKQISDICKKEKVLLIFCSYPEFMPFAMKQLAKDEDVLLVDLRPYYEEAQSKFPHKQYIISEDDPHCTKAGYYVMAEAIKNKIIGFCKDNPDAFKMQDY